MNWQLIYDFRKLRYYCLERRRANSSTSSRRTLRPAVRGDEADRRRVLEVHRLHPDERVRRAVLASQELEQVVPVP